MDLQPAVEPVAEWRSLRRTTKKRNEKVNQYLNNRTISPSQSTRNSVTSLPFVDFLLFLSCFEYSKDTREEHTESISKNVQLHTCAQERLRAAEGQGKPPSHSSVFLC